MSYDAVMTKLGRSFWKAYMDSRPCMYALDESPRIKTPGSKRSMRISGSSKACPYRRILTGTIVDDKPFDVYNQIRFLDPTVWFEIGCSDFGAFKNTFGIWKKQSMLYTDKEGKVKEREFPMLVEYRNLDLLKRIVARYGSRLRKEDVLDLPPKLYSKRYFDMTPAQWRAYKDLQAQHFTILDSGEMLSTDLAITRILRLQQITSGYLPSDDDESLIPLGDRNLRVELLLECVEEAGHQVIVWAKYRQDITAILAALRDAKIAAVRYDGQCNETQMGEAVDSFKAGDAQVFVANPAKGSEGLTLTCAKTMIYYNNGYRLSRRIQSEDRFHRIGQTDPVHIIDLAAVDTVDTAIIDVLRKKHEMAAFVQGDEIRAWI
jgi:SNF2 family DNA or RNA helicase